MDTVATFNYTTAELSMCYTRLEDLMENKTWFYALKKVVRRRGFKPRSTFGTIVEAGSFLFGFFLFLSFCSSPPFLSPLLYTS